MTLPQTSLAVSAALLAAGLGLAAAFAPAAAGAGLYGLAAAALAIRLGWRSAPERRPSRLGLLLVLLALAAAALASAWLWPARGGALVVAALGFLLHAYLLTPRRGRVRCQLPASVILARRPLSLH